MVFSKDTSGKCKKSDQKVPKSYETFYRDLNFVKYDNQLFNNRNNLIT